MKIAVGINPRAVNPSDMEQALSEYGSVTRIIDKPAVVTYDVNLGFDIHPVLAGHYKDKIKEMHGVTRASLHK